MTTLTLITAGAEQRAEWILDNACQVAVQFIRNGTPQTARLMLDRAQRYAAELLA